MKTFRHMIHFSLLVLLILIFLFPLYWMTTTAVKTEAENLRWPITLWPETFTLNNFRQIFAHPEDTPVFTWFRNSLAAASAYAVLSVTISLLAGFAVGRMDFAGRRLYITVMLVAMAIPGIVLLIPSFMLINHIGWTDSLLAIVIPALSGPFGVLLISQYLSKIPKDLEEAAMLDGATSFSILRHIILPYAKPVLITLLVLNFMGNWNDYFWPFINLFSPETRTMPIGMATLQGRFELFYGSMTAGATLMAIPSIVLFALIQKYYIRSITLAGGLKE